MSTLLAVPKKEPLVLFYTTFFSKPVDVASIQCDLPGEFTLDKRRIAEATAVVFHIPNFREIGDAWRYPGQYWIAWYMEARSNYKIIKDQKLMRHFDFTMSHERSSEIWCPYLPNSRWWDAVRAKPIGAKTEAAPVVAFQSAPLNYSGRLDLLKSLAEHIKIDSYGRYFRNSTVEGPDRGRKTKIETVSRYKFCLALENSTETDYVTEKLFDAFDAGSVPIYLGTSNVHEFAPPGSYINAADFSSYAELAAYLKYLIETPEAYEAYFAWRSKPLPDELARLVQDRDPPVFYRLMQFVHQVTDERGQERPAGRPTLPFGPRAYISTRLRKWRKRVPS
ncbi:glycosyltransferase family 10 [Mesorhizobium sp. M6A.T.Ce.TU.016.01.1.1]|uniref:glycosyltransferase family 10 domain-containing protein n=1 Tax=Mesorhizobium sp. M6A.T.Ce.TU.016.01.1.1 TaxID=2496783 RepID=UPI001FDF3FAD|nr:glycosyltransferase family 10 [Mesorhizobium sp. M6A.T.Ce.TU.016.01.1.1]